MRLERIERMIYLIRGQKVMLDSDLAELYGVPTRALNQAVKRHENRFPGDFMFRLSAAEMKDWRSQIVISNSSARMGVRWRPHAFTEQGVAMLSSVLNSDRALQVNIAIMRAFVRLREVLATHKELAKRLTAIERQLADHDGALGEHAEQIRSVFEAIRQLMATPTGPERRMGFHVRDRVARYGTRRRS